MLRFTKTKTHIVMYFMKFLLNISTYVLAFSLKCLDFKAKTQNLIEHCLFAWSEVWER
jgi:hypothetical protein